MLTISLLFKKLQILRVNNSRIYAIKNAKFSRCYFHMNLNIWEDFQICISAPLNASFKRDQVRYLSEMDVHKEERMILLEAVVRRCP